MYYKLTLREKLLTVLMIGDYDFDDLTVENEPTPLKPNAAYQEISRYSQGTLAFTQILTPLLSPEIATDGPEEGPNSVSISTAFYPGSHPMASDLVLSSSDSVLFYVHSEVLQIRCQSYILNVPDTSAVLNVIIHMLYNTSCARFSPSFEILVTAVNQLPCYKIVPKAHILPSTPLFSLLLSFAPIFPLELYALASHFDLHDLAVSTSSHLLSYPLASITDELAEQTGAVYLKRLFFLHIDRAEALKQILLFTPQLHPQTRECDFTEQKKLTRAWALMSAHLAWEARPDLPAHAMQSALEPVSGYITCKLCHQALDALMKDAVSQWAMVKRTI